MIIPSAVSLYLKRRYFLNKLLVDDVKESFRGQRVKDCFPVKNINHVITSNTFNISNNFTLRFLLVTLSLLFFAYPRFRASLPIETHTHTHTHTRQSLVTRQSREEALLRAASSRLVRLSRHAETYPILLRVFEPQGNLESAETIIEFGV